MHYFLLLLCCLLSACGAVSEKKAAEPAAVKPSAEKTELPPQAVLQAGKYPLWFQFTGGQPQLLETIDDAILSAALVPWPRAHHVRFMLAHKNRILMAENASGIICFAPWTQKNKTTTVETSAGGSIGLYRFSSGEYWQNYTVGAFFMYLDNPTALLYQDDRFIHSDESPPSPRLWTIDFFSGSLRPLSLSLLDAFASDDGWNIDTLREGGDGRWYFRAVNKTTVPPAIKMFRHNTLIYQVPPPEGEVISSGLFQNSALPLPLVQASGPLAEMLAEIFIKTGFASAAVVSPAFPAVRHYAVDRESAPLSAFYSETEGADSSGSRLWVTDPGGVGLYLEKAAGGITAREIVLPSLPAGFVYTGIGITSDVIVAAWEEQEGYSTGAAGFMVILSSAVNGNYVEMTE